MDESWGYGEYSSGKGWACGKGDGYLAGFGAGDDLKGGKGASKRRRYDEFGEKISSKRASGGRSRAAARIAAGEPFYHGQVRSFNVEKKHGYVACEAVHAMCGQDVYAFQDVLERGKAGPAGPGDTVAFFLHWSTRGQPQASSPLIRLSGPGAAHALKGAFKAARDVDRGCGFGFLECEETREFFGRDVYVARELAAGLAPGQLVAFSVYLNWDGMPNAHALEPCDEAWEPERGDVSTSREVTIDVGKGAWRGDLSSKGKGSKGAWGAMDDWGAWGGDPSGWGAWGWGGDWWGCGPQAFMALPGVDGPKGSKGSKGSGKGKGARGSLGPQGGGRPVPTGRAYTGVIKSFNEANNYGFIECGEVKAEYGFDVFVHGRELCGQTVGSVVYFEVGVSSKGQPQALHVQTLEPEAAAEDALEPPAKRQRAGTNGPVDVGPTPLPAIIRGELEPAGDEVEGSCGGAAAWNAVPGWTLGAPMR